MQLTRPVKNGCRGRLRLSYGGVVLLTIRGEGTRYEAILDAFRLEDWAERIDDPLPRAGVVDPPRRRRDAIGDLNRAIRAVAVTLEPSLTEVPQFKADGSGQGILWRVAALVVRRARSAARGKKRHAAVEMRPAARHWRRVAGVSV